MHATPPFPRKVLVAAAALAAFTIGAAATARLTGLGSSTQSPNTVSEVRELRFEDRDDGAVVVIDASGGDIVQTLPPGADGFVRIVMRTLARERRMHGEGRETPFRLVRRDDGRLSMEDPATGRRIDLSAFGAPNTLAFARLLTSDGETP